MKHLFANSTRYISVFRSLWRYNAILWIRNNIKQYVTNPVGNICLLLCAYTCRNRTKLKGFQCIWKIYDCVIIRYRRRWYTIIRKLPRCCFQHMMWIKAAILFKAVCSFYAIAYYTCYVPLRCFWRSLLKELSDLISRRNWVVKRMAAVQMSVGDWNLSTSIQSLRSIQTFCCQRRDSTVLKAKKIHFNILPDITR